MFLTLQFVTEGHLLTEHSYGEMSTILNKSTCGYNKDIYEVKIKYWTGIFISVASAAAII